MINKVGRFFAWLFVAVLGLYWLRRDAKKDQQRQNAKEVLDRVQDAEQVDSDIDRLSPGDKRDRLRQRNRQ